MHLISRPIFDTEIMGFPQRHIGQFISSKLRSSAAELAVPEFSKKQEGLKEQETCFVRLAFLFVLLILKHQDNSYIRNVGRH